ncbi:hypothetical protein [Labrys okinawensis]|uniref:hypothetical protein n=1 Tax=Labrys okinawensis TaxID=346911 RepID=UPI0011B1EE3F|nr:hypothetical protein [Labrys okinawensis]
MPASSDALYRAHVKNLRAVNTALERIFRELNGSLAREDGITADAFLKTAMLLIGGWAENRLRKLAYEPNGFSLTERAKISASNSQLEAWKAALELGFRKRYVLPHADLQTALSITARLYYNTLLEIIENELKPIIEIRNKLAHGQWSRTLNSENDDFSPTLMASINNENAFTVKCKMRIMESLARLIHDLVAGNHAFERDFDRHFRNLESAKRDISTRSYNNWINNMRAKLQRGKQVRNSS